MRAMKFAGADESHPVHSVEQLEADVAGVKTKFFAEKFSDRILILITQTGKIGTIVSLMHIFISNSIPTRLKMPFFLPETDPLVFFFKQIQAGREITMEGNPSFTVQTLLGAPSDDLSLDLCARRIIESVAMASTTSLPIILCVSLQATSVPQELVKELVEIVVENKVW
ncbi:hypothetical protein NDN08_002761 [Rhodosorus marinus]|uniref:Proteasome assembly chaperone 3 n=1 Tax=Rhodosorus marinus TaxID=101924 RepID=A0AAV8UXB7_9RHOD|nr:hypothetical protein NDN08_002761 [Rhodosorus marinus]